MKVTSNIMETRELKNKIIQYLNRADEETLRIVNEFFETYEKKQTDSKIVAPEVFKKLIERGLEDSKSGRIRSHNDVMMDVNKRYNIQG